MLNHINRVYIYKFLTEPRFGYFTKTELFTSSIRYYGIDKIKDEGESQCYLYLSSLKNFKLNKSNYASNFNYVDINSTKIENIYNELVDKNFDEVWFYNGKTFDNIVNLIFQSDEEALSNLTSVLGLKNIVSKGLIFDVVAF